MRHIYPRHRQQGGLRSLAANAIARLRRARLVDWPPQRGAAYSPCIRSISTRTVVLPLRDVADRAAQRQLRGSRHTPVRGVPRRGHVPAPTADWMPASGVPPQPKVRDRRPHRHQHRRRRSTTAAPMSTATPPTLRRWSVLVTPTPTGAPTQGKVASLGHRVDPAPSV